jgi:hypothetical protein
MLSCMITRYVTKRTILQVQHWFFLGYTWEAEESIDTFLPTISSGVQIVTPR